MKEAIDHLTVDPIFNSIIENTECHNSRTSTRIETLVLLILEQQVSIDSAKATFKIKGKDKNLRPCTLDLSDQEFRVYGVGKKNILYQSIVICCN
jgi:DNA-3-methyladenine glycosylase II